MTRIVMIFVEGTTDLVFYERLLDKIFKATMLKRAPEEVEELVRTIRGRRCSHLRLEERDVIVILVDCGGFDRARELLKEYLLREDLDTLIANGLYALVLAGDKDRKPKEVLESMIRDVMNHVDIKFMRKDDKFVASINGTSLSVYYIEQGHKKEIEEWLEQVLRQRYRREAEAIASLERMLGYSLSPKQRIGIFEALLTEHEGVSRLVAKLLEVIDVDEITEKWHYVIERLRTILS